MKSNNIVEINGKLYDAKTGVALSGRAKTAPAQKPVQAKTATPKAASTARKTRSIDGVHKPTRATYSKAAPKKTAAPATKPAKSTRHNATTHVGLKAKRSTTLNRRVVKVPQIAVSAPIESQLSEVSVSSSALKQGDSQRLKRAQTVSKSSVISRFNKGPKPAPIKHTKVQSTLENHVRSTQSLEEKRLSTKERLVKKAIEGASLPAKPVRSHHAPVKRQRSRKSRAMQYASTTVATLLLAGYVAYLNVPSISMKVAAHRAGFAANLPTYKPAGYSLKGPIAYSPGQVTLNFSSNTDDRKFSLTQQPTTWDSTALLENLVTKESGNYLTYQDRGLTIYIYDDSNAAWVNGNKLYKVEGKNSRLNTDQLLKLATGV